MVYFGYINLYWGVNYIASFGLHINNLRHNNTDLFTI